MDLVTYLNARLIAIFTVTECAPDATLTDSGRAINIVTDLVLEGTDTRPLREIIADILTPEESSNG